MQNNEISSGNFFIVSEQGWDWTFGGIFALIVIHSLACDTHLEKFRNI